MRVQTCHRSSNERSVTCEDGIGHLNAVICQSETGISPILSLWHLLSAISSSPPVKFLNQIIIRLHLIGLKCKSINSKCKYTPSIFWHQLPRYFNWWPWCTRCEDTDVPRSQLNTIYMKHLCECKYICEQEAEYVKMRTERWNVRLGRLSRVRWHQITGNTEDLCLVRATVSVSNWLFDEALMLTCARVRGSYRRISATPHSS